jgi:hypothetical protein
MEMWPIYSILGFFATGGIGLLINSIKNLNTAIDTLNRDINKLTISVSDKFAVHISRETFFEFKKENGRVLEELRSNYSKILISLSVHEQMLKDLKESLREAK